MTEKLKKTLLLIYRRIYRIIFGYARISLVAVVGIVSAQVVARNIFKSNIRWNQEVALLLTIWMAFLGLSIGVDKGLHIKVELFFSMFPKAVQKAVQTPPAIQGSRKGGRAPTQGRSETGVDKAQQKRDLGTIQKSYVRSSRLQL